MFKTDDLKGPIFDYYIDDNTYEFDLWSNLIQKEKYQMPPLKKNEIFYYDHLFITTIDANGCVNIPAKIIGTMYQELAEEENNVLFGGRLAEYKYYKMDEVIKKANSAPLT